MNRIVLTWKKPILNQVVFDGENARIFGRFDQRMNLLILLWVKENEVVLVIVRI
jgi:hypothetical protein